MKRFILPVLCLSFSLTAFAEPPTCPDAHVWYSMTNESQKNWAVQIARLYENNISFMDENCTKIDLNEKIILSPSQTRYVGLNVEETKGFYATFSFMGVALPNANINSVQIPKGIPYCAFIIAPYSPGHMDTVDWKSNNADCYSNNYGTEMHFK